jgi:dTDP-4-dehydrorhamnose 3,5-epimerase
MEVVPTRLEGPLLIEPRLFPDERGFFVETFRASAFEELGITEPMVQHNHSRSVRGTVRGMHFHAGEGVSKVVRCSRGRILDVLVDMRPASTTFGEWEGFELDDETLRMLYVPVGFGHGFCVLSDVADVAYLQSAYYSPEAERGFSPLDPEVAIEWPVADEDLIISERDLRAPMLNELDGLSG